MSALSNDRRHPRTGAIAWRVMDTEQHTVAVLPNYPGLYGFQLQDRPRQTTVVVTEDITGGATFTQVLTDPLAGQCFVDYSAGYILFNVADNGTVVLVDYEGGGSNASLENILIGANDPGPAINAAVTKTTPADNDRFVLTDSAASYITKKTLWSNIKDAIMTAFIAYFNALTAKTSIVDADRFLITDSAASFVSKKITSAEIKAYVKVKYAKLSDTKSSGTNGGTATSGSFQTRDLNTEDSDDDNIVSLSSNQFTLGAGTYIICASAPAFGVDHHIALLRNTSDSTNVIIGTSEYTTGTVVTTHSLVKGQFTIAGTKTFEIQHRVGTTVANVGFGTPASFSVSEIYTVVELWKLP